MANRRSESRRRGLLVGVRLDPTEYAIAHARAEDAGVTIPELIRQLLTRTPAEKQ